MASLQCSFCGSAIYYDKETLIQTVSPTVFCSHGCWSAFHDKLKQYEPKKIQFSTKEFGVGRTFVERNDYRIIMSISPYSIGATPQEVRTRILYKCNVTLLKQYQPFSVLFCTLSSPNNNNAFIHIIAVNAQNTSEDIPIETGIVFNSNDELILTIEERSIAK